MAVDAPWPGRSRCRRRRARRLPKSRVAAAHEVEVAVPDAAGVGAGAGDRRAQRGASGPRAGERGRRRVELLDRRGRPPGVGPAGEELGRGQVDDEGADWARRRPSPAGAWSRPLAARARADRARADARGRRGGRAGAAPAMPRRRPGRGRRVQRQGSGEVRRGGRRARGQGVRRVGGSGRKPAMGGGGAGAVRGGRRPSNGRHGQGRQARAAAATRSRCRAGGAGQAARAAAVEDGARARRRRLHRRRLRDRRAAGARPAVGQHDVNDFDVYVGTSAPDRSIAALAANGVTPEEMMRASSSQAPTPLRDIDIGQLLRPNLVEYARRASLLPLRAASVAARAARHARPGLDRWTSSSGSAEGLPSGFYTGVGHRGLHAEVLSDPDRTDDFRMLSPRALPRRDRPRHLRADRLRRRRLGRRPDLDRRARLDGAADGLLAGPVRDRELIDGGIVSTTNLDIAVEARREVRRRRQPARPVRQRLHASGRRRCSARGRGASATWASRRSATRRSR